MEAAIKKHQAELYHVLDRYYRLMNNEVSLDVYSLNVRLRQLHHTKKRLYANPLLKDNKAAKQVMFKIRDEQIRIKSLMKEMEVKIYTDDEIKKLVDEFPI